MFRIYLSVNISAVCGNKNDTLKSKRYVNTTCLNTQRRFTQIPIFLSIRQFLIKNILYKKKSDYAVLCFGDP